MPPQQLRQPEQACAAFAAAKESIKQWRLPSTTAFTIKLFGRGLLPTGVVTNDPRASGNGLSWNNALYPEQIADFAQM